MSSTDFNLFLSDEVCNQKTPDAKTRNYKRRRENEDLKDVIKRELRAYVNRVHLLDSSQCLKCYIDSPLVDPLTSKHALISFLFFWLPSASQTRLCFSS